MMETRPIQTPMGPVWHSAYFVQQVSQTTMTKIELNRFRTALKNKSAELENSSRGREALAIETSADELDRIQHGQERDLAMGNLARESKLLRQVQDALSRMDRGTFGICADCEEDISSKRLAAVPWTDSCIRCQEVADSARAGRPWSADQELPVAA